MSSENFTRTEYVIPGQHIRHYARGTSQNQEVELKIVVKQYTPHYNQPASPGDVTIIASHASGFPKELYEPMWDRLFNRTLQSNGPRIRNIWIADVVNQNASGVLNEHELGNERRH